ncbi:hypothetical protein PE36_07372 [Moritella sp. PE36]|uniref:hypothetical protein n=1 Tax=Moritella sp. PE36 TaxID=58051 RepID=UPI00015689CA|nr:hypothetical protein [Moritella sp. PE36]EDM69289.1 hypothetical protein PE36_07372 [Moritella sp. PE36]
MSTFNLFVEAFKSRVVLKANQGKNSRVAEFDAVVSDIEMVHGAIPDICKIRAYFTVCISSKPNWGCRKVIEEFDYAVTKIRGDG